jgi:hypothetical protein
MTEVYDLSPVTWDLIGFMLLLIAYFHGPSYSAQTVRNTPSILTSFGIFGTFLGIAFGLMRFDSADIEARVPIMIDGLGVAVWSSIVGILGGLSIRLRNTLSSIRKDSDNVEKPATVSDLNNTITTLNSNLEQLREESRADSQALLASTRSYQEQMVEANSDALTTALAKVMTEFNSRIQVQYGENFQKFNESLGRLLQ